MIRRSNRYEYLENVWLYLCFFAVLGLLAIFPSSLPAEEIPSPLACFSDSQTSVLHHWSMDTVITDSFALSDVGGGTYGLLKNNAILAPGWMKKGIQFAEWAYASMTGSASADMNFGKTDKFSISLWVKTSDNNGSLLEKGTHPDDKYAGYGIRISGNKLQFNLTSKYVTANSFDAIGIEAATSGIIADNQWHFVVATYDGSNTVGGLKLYMDGALASTTPPAVGAQTALTGDIKNTREVRIGRRADAWSGSFFTGMIDEVLVLNRVLTAEEVTCIYEETKGPICGNTFIEGIETCDDGNVTAGDGCGATCYEEPGYVCAGEPNVCTVATCIPPPADMIHWWPMDETLGTTAAANRIGIGNVAGTLKNGASFETGYVQNALRLDQSDFQFVSLGSQIMNFEKNDPFSLSLWVNSTADKNAVLVAKMEGVPLHRGYELLWWSGRLSFFLISDLSSTIATKNYIGIQEAALLSPYIDGRWHMVTATYNGSGDRGGLRLYVDGQQIVTVPYIFPSPHVDHTTLLENSSILTAAEVEIGDRVLDNIYCFDGLLDEIMVFSRALSEDEVRSLYKARTKGVCKTDPTCDGIDDDMDGMIDDNYSPHATTCGVETCTDSGVTSCAGGKEFDSCVAPLGGPELCDEKDNNCDGNIDEGGICQTDTTCDGTDNDGDGKIDDDYVTRSTTCGAGVCAATGKTACIDGIENDSCTPSGSAELCDGKDNNCDGVIDEGDTCKTADTPPPASAPEQTIPEIPDPESTPTPATPTSTTSGGCALLIFP